MSGVHSHLLLLLISTPACSKDIVDVDPLGVLGESLVEGIALLADFSVKDETRVVTLILLHFSVGLSIIK